MKMISGQVILVSAVYYLQAILPVQFAMPEFSRQETFDLVYCVLLYTLVFAIFEKIQKERFVINLTNQQ